jgi:hypothetical protein
MLQHFWDHIFVINIFWLLPTFFRNVPTFFENVGFVNYFFGDILQNVAIFFLKISENNMHPPTVGQRHLARGAGRHGCW